MSQLALFDDPAPRHAHSRCDGTCLTHALLPNMAYACGETILTVGGHFEMGTSNFDAVTCPECRSEGVDNIRVRMRRQMGLCVTCAEPLDKRGECKGCSL